jgi:hypothetical protein
MRKAKSGLWLPREGQGLSHVCRPRFHPNLVNPYIRGVADVGYGWAPSDVAGLVFWWRADLGVTLTGSDIDEFADHSGNANDGTKATTAGANPAELQTNITGSLAAAYFDGVAGLTQYQLPLNAFSGITASQVFMAIKCDDNTPATINTTGLFRFSTETGTGQNQAIFYPYTDDDIYDCFGTTTRYQFDSPGSLTSWHRLSIQNGAGGYQMWKNNASVFSNATAGGSHWVSNPSFGGNEDTGNHRRFKGYLLEIFMYDSVLSSGDRGDADQYLADRIDGTWYAAENP